MAYLSKAKYLVIVSKTQPLPSLRESVQADSWQFSHLFPVIANEHNFSRHCETYEVSRGNLNRIANDGQNTQLAIQ